MYVDMYIYIYIFICIYICIPCNTALLIAKCPSKNACYFLVKETKNKSLSLVLKNFWL